MRQNKAQIAKTRREARKAATAAAGASDEEDVQTMSNDTLLARVRGLLAGWHNHSPEWDLEVIQTYEKRMGFGEIDDNVDEALASGSALTLFVQPSGTGRDTSQEAQPMASRVVAPGTQRGRRSAAVVERLPLNDTGPATLADPHALDRPVYQAPAYRPPPVIQTTGGSGSGGGATGLGEEPEDLEALSTGELVELVRQVLDGRWEDEDEETILDIIQVFEERMGFDEIDDNLDDAFAEGSALREYLRGPASVVLDGFEYAAGNKKDTVDVVQVPFSERLLTPVTLLGGALTLAARHFKPKWGALSLIPAVAGVGLSLMQNGSTKKVRGSV